ncbi:hypothetical protein [Streptomyces sp. NPDC058751]|uniref:hypothetical protein n=1 Tax=Streptomyces sp. NPDC058751 TaxID=3346623 RepID=UPI00369912AC
MCRMTHRRRLLTCGTVAALAVLALPHVASAYGPGGGQGAVEPDVSGDADGKGVLSATAGAVVFDRSKNGTGRSAGPVTSAGNNWAPPACHYAPKYTPTQLKAHLEPIREAGPTGHEWDAEQRDRYVIGKPYKDFNKDKTGEGYWWDSYVAPGRAGNPDALDCTKDTFWVDTDDDPPADIPQAITPQVPAELAYNEIRTPGTEVALAPEGTTKVNLPTWAWLDGAEFKPVSVTASVPLLNIEATAEPISLKIDPSTEDSETYPASGVCEIGNGKIGEPYAEGKSEETPPCGVKYLHSSGNGSYPLTASVTWKISWTGTGVNEVQDLPDGEFGAEQSVIVQEIQTVNR